MELEIYADNLEASDVKNNEREIICRGVVKHNDLYLLIEENSRSLFTLPGGKLEGNETIKDCVVREVLEETGVLVKSPIETVTITEHFLGVTYVSHYFLCDYVDTKKEQNLTKQEQNIGIHVHWVDVETALQYFSEHKSTFEHASTIQQREFLGFIHSI